MKHLSLILSLTAFLMFGCETRTEVKKVFTKSESVQLQGYQEACKGTARMVTLARTAFDQGAGCGWREHQEHQIKLMLKEAANYSRKNKVLSTRNIYDTDRKVINFVEIIYCAEEE